MKYGAFPRKEKGIRHHFTLTSSGSWKSSTSPTVSLNAALLLSAGWCRTTGLTCHGNLSVRHLLASTGVTTVQFFRTSCRPHVVAHCSQQQVLDQPAVAPGAYLSCEEYFSCAYWNCNPIAIYASRYIGPLLVTCSLLCFAIRFSISSRKGGRDSPRNFQFHAPPAPWEDHARGDSRFPYLEKLRVKASQFIACHTCAETHDIVSLLTGFSPSPTSALELRALREQIKAAETRTQEGFQQLAGAHLASDLQLKRGLSEVAFQFRAIRHMLANEMHDCPGLFALSRQRSRNPLARRYVLTLFCEETNQVHARALATYNIPCSRSVVSEVQPFLDLIVPLLSLAVPIVGTLASSAINESLKLGVETLTTGREFLTAQGSTADIETAVGQLGGPANDEARRGYRTFRYLLLNVDPAREFGGLVRRTTAAGDNLWLCPEHLQSYDPGLPTLD